MDTLWLVLVGLVAFVIGVGVLWLLALILIALGRVAVKTSGVARFALWIGGVILFVGLLPAVFVAAVFLHYMTPPFTPFSKPFGELDKLRQGFTGFLDLVWHPLGSQIGSSGQP